MVNRSPGLGLRGRTDDHPVVRIRTKEFRVELERSESGRYRYLGSFPLHRGPPDALLARLHEEERAQLRHWQTQRLRGSPAVEPVDAWPKRLPSTAEEFNQLLQTAAQCLWRMPLQDCDRHLLTRGYAMIDHALRKRGVPTLRQTLRPERVL